MSYLRAFLALVLAAALSPLLLSGPGNAAVPLTKAESSAERGDRTTASSKARSAQRSRIAVLPKINHKGLTDTSADRAKAIGEVRVWPAREGRKVVVQRRASGETSWSNVGRPEKTNAKGIVYFKPRGSFADYRAKVKAFQGEPGFTTNEATDSWGLLFEDQFSGSKLASTWSTRGTGYDKGSLRKCSKASPKMVDVGGGALTVKVKKDGSRRGDVCKWRKPGTSKRFKYPYYLNGHIGTDSTFSFRHGVSAARVKFQKPRGMHGSFWMNTSGEPQGTRPVEIDTAEYFGNGHKDGGLAQFLHYKGRKIGGLQKSANDLLTGTDDWWKKYHVFSVEWTPGGYVFRIDGRETFRTSKARSDKQVILIMSLLSSDYELKDMPDSGKGSMKVDWVRVWQDPNEARNLQ